MNSVRLLIIWKLPYRIFLHVLNPQMKISLIFGIIHMTFGVMLSLWNMVSFFVHFQKFSLSNYISVTILMCFFLKIEWFLFRAMKNIFLFQVANRHYHEIVLEFLPRLIFLVFIFGYLILMIFIKWFYYGANLPDPYR